ncbi:hypothetical protein D3C85_877440 [compost metagenome]
MFRIRGQKTGALSVRDWAILLSLISFRVHLLQTYRVETVLTKLRFRPIWQAQATITKENITSVVTSEETETLLYHQIINGVTLVADL